MVSVGDTVRFVSLDTPDVLFSRVAEDVTVVEYDGEPMIWDGTALYGSGRQLNLGSNIGGVAVVGDLDGDGQPEVLVSGVDGTRTSVNGPNW